MTVTRLLTAAYLASIVAANLTAARFGPAATIPVALILIALDLTARDRLHDAWHHRHLRAKMTALIATGGLISYTVNVGATRIAIASTLAFAAAAAVDSGVYTLARRLPPIARANLSNFPSAAVDSAAFQTIAFGFAPLVILGQTVAKILGGALWSLVLFRRRPA
jgi:queuosine precursor transporter